MQERPDPFTERARKVLRLAEEEARRFNHNYIGTEHLLLGMLREGDGVAAKVLSNLGVELVRVRSALEFIIGRGEKGVTGDFGLTPRARNVIDLAWAESRQLGHTYIGTEHMLLGLIAEGEGIACIILENLGVNLERARSEVIKVITGAGPDPLARGRFSYTSPHLGPHFEYFLADTQRVADETRITGVHGHEAVFESGADGAPLQPILLRLGEEGWELAAIDRLDGLRVLYVFKRGTL